MSFSLSAQTEICFVVQSKREEYGVGVLSLSFYQSYFGCTWPKTRDLDLSSPAESAERDDPGPCVGEVEDSSVIIGGERLRLSQVRLVGRLMLSKKAKHLI